ncbi:hypothetical protein WN55_01743 [Dufourea novaeangliae]|uniref:Uncharacterized protein n=1 Tax=Dufourea novaeangliae TaxID=178035 RepID=A0A154PDU1_DUFNO|nr:hypothetical protein WN55_01743 [Dufourea novaeangliae]
MRAGSGIQIGTSDRSTHAKGSSIRGSGVRLGEGRFPNSTRQRTFTSTTTTIPPPLLRFTNAPHSTEGNSHTITYLKVGMLVPHKSFGVRDYTKAVTSAVNTLQKSTRGPKLKLFERYDIHVKVAMKELTPSPTNGVAATTRRVLGYGVLTEDNTHIAVTILVHFPFGPWEWCSQYRSMQSIKRGNNEIGRPNETFTVSPQGLTPPKRKIHRQSTGADAALNVLKTCHEASLDSQMTQSKQQDTLRLKIAKTGDKFLIRNNPNVTNCMDIDYEKETDKQSNSEYRPVHNKKRKVIIPDNHNITNSELLQQDKWLSNNIPLTNLFSLLPEVSDEP